jgi:hypothetical protein
MASERRDNPRFPMNLDCAVSQDNREFQRCKTLNISQEGAFIITPGKHLRDNTRVTLAIRTSSAGRSEVHRYNALVRHVTAEGIGLYIRHDPQTRSLVETVMSKRSL